MTRPQHQRTRAKRYSPRQHDPHADKRPPERDLCLRCLANFAEPDSEYCAACELRFAGR